MNIVKTLMILFLNKNAKIKFLILISVVFHNILIFDS